MKSSIVYWALGGFAIISCVSFLLLSRRKSSKKTNRFVGLNSTSKMPSTKETMKWFEEASASVDLNIHEVKERVIERHVGTSVIAIAGVDRGAGATHLSIALANHLVKQKYKVALVEANALDEFCYIEKAYEGTKHLINSPSFVINGVTYYRSFETDDMSKLMNEYSYVILDTGKLEESSMHDQFFRANISVVVSRSAEWKQHTLMEFLQKYEPDCEDWRICVNEGLDLSLGDVRKELSDFDVIGIPSCPDPYQLSKDMHAALDKISSFQMKRISFLEKKKAAYFKRINED